MQQLTLSGKPASHFRQSGFSLGSTNAHPGGAEGDSHQDLDSVLAPGSSLTQTQPLQATEGRTSGLKSSLTNKKLKQKNFF